METETRLKYPRTFHLPWSESVGGDDHMLSPAILATWKGRRVIVTEKRDGENTTMYANHIHARSLDSCRQNHPSRDWVKQFWGTIRHTIPPQWRICGENMFAKHSIAYENLETYFEGFSLWEGKTCFAWDETLFWFEMLGIKPVPVLYDGPFDEKLIRGLWTPDQASTVEGYVVRDAEDIAYDDFNTKVAKFVRKNHVATDQHWMFAEIVKNKLKE
jgi:hypothetical protein